MSKELRRNDLGYLGEDFQYRLVHAFMENHEFFEDLAPILNQNMFTNPNLRIFVGTLKNYYEAQGYVPSYPIIETCLREKAHTEMEQDEAIAIVNKIKETSDEGMDLIKDLAMKFFKQQNMIRVANEILKIAGNGNTERYDECAALLNDAVTQGVHNDFGEGVFDHINETLSDDYRCPIPTGIGKIDETLEGGLGKGELGVIIAPSGIGKSSLTTAMASHAALSGFKVLQIVFEDRIKQIQRKHFGRLTGIEAKDLSKPENIEAVKEALKPYQEDGKLAENLRIVKFPSGEKTARQIKNFIVKLSNNGFKPDLVIVDYFECLAHESSKDTTNEYEKEGKTMRFFESMVGELDIALWVPSQGTKDSINMELITMDKIGGSVKKAQIAHIILSIARSVDDIAANKATIAILKNRAGKSGKVFNGVDFNNGTCRISTDNVDELDSLFEYKQQKSDELLNTQKTVFSLVGNGSKKS